MSDFFAHPLTVLIVGAILTGLLVPAITRRWQNRQKELEVKVELISELSEAIMQIVMAVQVVRVRAELPRSAMSDENSPERDEDVKAFQEMNKAYRTWEVRSAVLGTRLEAFFSGTAIPADWTSFSDIVTRFYALEGQSEVHRQRNLKELLAKVLPHMSPDKRDLKGWPGLKEAILTKKGEIINDVLTSRISAFRSGIFEGPGHLWRILLSPESWSNRRT